jgi:hypothetical protein
MMVFRSSSGWKVHNSCGLLFVMLAVDSVKDLGRLAVHILGRFFDHVCLFRVRSERWGFSLLARGFATRRVWV